MFRGGIMQRYFAKEIVNDNIVLEDSDIHHIKTVMRMKVNDKIEVIYDKKLYICSIEQIDNLTLKIDSVIEENNGLNKEIIVAVGLVKEQKMDLILQKLTELGVSRIIPVNMERSIVKLDSKKCEKKLLRWKLICKEASEQSKRNDVPLVNDVINLKDLINIEADLKLVCSVSEESNMIYNYIEEDNYNSILFVIGPEGGISKKEEEYLKNNNFNLVSFGKLVLRVETACIYIASVLNYIVNKKVK